MTKSGQGKKINLTEVQDYNKTIRLKKEDEIIATIPYNDEETKEILYITLKGWGYRFLLSDIRIMRTENEGISCAKITEETGPVSAAIEVTTKEITVITGGDLEQTLNIKDIPILPRGSQGVKLINLNDGDWIEDIEETD